MRSRPNPFGTGVGFTAVLCLSSGAAAHVGHQEQLPGIIDPLVTHHAVLEDELKLNYAGTRIGDDEVTAHVASLELAYAFTDFLGAELFVPFGVVSTPGGTDVGLGDLDVLVPKLSFVRHPGFVMTTYVSVRFPTGDESIGLGEPGWSFAPHLLADSGFGNFGIQSNVAVEVETEGHVALEGNLSLTYSWIAGAAAQSILSPLVEANVEAPLDGEQAVALALTPGIKLGLAGWHFGAGVQLPVTRPGEFDYAVLIQAGYHVAWKDIFASSPR